MPESSTPSNNLRDRWIAVEVVNHTARSLENGSQDETQLAIAVRRVLQAFGVCRADVSVAIVDDCQIAQIHRDYLGQDSPTDVITFPLSDAREGALRGDILVSLDTAEREAAARGLSPTGELLLYVVHGALHLVGLDDHTDDRAAEMRHWEQVFVEAFGYRYAFDTPSSMKQNPS